MHRLSPVQRAGVLLPPWLFVAAFTWVWLGVLVPRALEGNVALACISLIAGIALACFVIAAFTFSRDVLRDHWPAR